MKKIKLGLVGAAGRPTAFLKAINASGHAALTAACDLNLEAMDKALEGIEGVEKYTDYIEMLDKSGIDAVIVGTPLPLHVEQSIVMMNSAMTIAVHNHVHFGCACHSWIGISTINAIKR